MKKRQHHHRLGGAVVWEAHLSRTGRSWGRSLLPAELDMLFGAYSSHQETLQ
jgi:hypothetical protein